MKTLHILPLALLVAASPLLAIPPINSTMTLAGLKSKCVELAGNEQLKPFKAKVSCSQTSTEWREMPGFEPVFYRMPNTREIGASFALKGYSIPFQSEAVEVAYTQVPCIISHQFRLTLPAADMEVSCEELQAVERIADLCSPVLDERIKADPASQTEEATGLTFNSCEGR